MKLFVDSADLAEIKEAASWGVIAGVTTNPTLLAKNGSRDVKSVIQEICQLVPDGPVSMEVVSKDAEGMLAEGREFVKWADNVIVKVPFTIEGMKAVAQFSKEEIATNVTLVFSPNQALLAANAGATFISLFAGRLDDIGQCGVDVVRQTVEMLENYPYESMILAASIRSPQHVFDCAVARADVATVPFKIIKQMYSHPLTDAGLAAFDKDWANLNAQALVGASA
jgi:transaldolase